jgi:hypothetical protein
MWKWENGKMWKCGNVKIGTIGGLTIKNEQRSCKIMVGKDC